MGSSESVWVLNVAMFLGGPCPVARLLVNRASMTGRRLRRSDGPRCCRFLASAPLAQKRVRIRPTDVRLVGGLSARKRASDSLKPSGAHLATKARYVPVGDRAGIEPGE
jgi:hypothetical protein